METLTPKNLKKLNSKRGLRLFLTHNDMTIQKALRILNQESQLARLQEELIKLQQWVEAKGEKLVIIFEGRDAAGKGGAIRRMTQHLNPREFNVVALPKPTDEEKSQWYFQRYVKNLPRDGQITFFDRSWYNRAVVEPVNKFCSNDEYNIFMNQVNNFERMIIDELLLMPEKVLNEVIMPFLSVIKNPTERQETYDLETEMIKQGKMKEEERTKWPNNKIIGLSSASYKFEHLYKMYSQYESLILNENEQDKAHRTIMHFSYDCAPPQLYDQNLIDQAKATMSQSQFDREFMAVFTDDSSGYFKVSKMAQCTIPDGEGQCVEVKGEPSDEYILAFDPSWSESDGSDDFAIMLLKLNKETRKTTVVHSYALPGANLKTHIKYMVYLLKNFNIIFIVGDYNGGVQFLNSCNESSIFKKNNLNLGVIDADLDNHQEYEKGLSKLKKQYNKDSKSYVFLRKPTSKWIRYGNELLQASFDHKRIFFAGAAMDDDYNRQRKASVGVKDLQFIRNYQESSEASKMIDFVEHQKDMMDLIKMECALIQVSTSVQGTQSFDLPTNLKKQTGADKARKDSYSALILGNWMTHVYYDMMDDKIGETTETFTPMFID